MKINLKIGVKDNSVIVFEYNNKLFHFIVEQSISFCKAIIYDMNKNLIVEGYVDLIDTDHSGIFQYITLSSIKNLLIESQVITKEYKFVDFWKRN